MIGNDNANTIEWDIDVPLLTNRHMLAAMAKAMLGAALASAMLVSIPLAMRGEWDAIANVGALFAMVGGGLFSLALLISAFPFRNRLRMAFRIDSQGVAMRQADRTVRLGNRAAFWAGLALGRPAMAGSGALVMTQEEQVLAWSGAFTVRHEPATRSIAFRNGWRTLMRVYCLPENFEAAAARVTAEVARSGAAARIRGKSPLGGYLWRTALVVACTLPLFAMADAFDLPGFAPFLLLCFGVAMVWMVRPLAWAVLGGLAWLAVALAAALAEVRQSMFGGGAYRRFEVLDGDNWTGLAVSALAGAALAWLAVAILRGRYTPALTQDWADAGDA